MGSKAKLSTERSSAAAKIGTMPRFREHSSGGSNPGPGHYGLPAVTTESHQISLPRVGFAKAIRDANKKVQDLNTDSQQVQIEHTCK